MPCFAQIKRHSGYTFFDKPHLKTEETKIIMVIEILISSIAVIFLLGIAYFIFKEGTK